jgi:hypothetical protein
MSWNSPTHMSRSKAEIVPPSWTSVYWKHHHLVRMRPYGQVDSRLADQELDFGAKKLKFDRYTNRFRAGCCECWDASSYCCTSIVPSPSCQSLHIKSLHLVTILTANEKVFRQFDHLPARGLTDHRQNMFRNTYQSGFLSILYSIG